MSEEWVEIVPAQRRSTGEAGCPRMPSANVHQRVAQHVLAVQDHEAG
jgi:hypothetical protein